MEEIADKVFRIKNFISEEERLFLLSKIKNFDNWGDQIPTISPADYWNDKRMNSNDPDLIFLLDSIQDKISNYFLKKYKITYPTIHRLYEKTNMDEHYDSEHDPSIKYGFIIYLNNNFDDGELEYINLNFKYTPVPGDLLMHPADLYHMHKVNQIKNGTRYTILFFAKERQK